MTGTGTNGTPRKCWHGTVALKLDPVRGPGVVGVPGRKPGTGHDMKHTHNAYRRF